MAAKNPLEGALLEHGAAKANERQTIADAARAVREGRIGDAAALLDEKLEEEGSASLALRAQRAERWEQA
ncbi:MAG: hypothetical protein EOP08_05475, partial [Proteobacteria bacterium]